MRRRYEAGLRNFFALYQPRATVWRMYDNSGSSDPRVVATGYGRTTTSIADAPLWTRIEQEYGIADQA